MYPRTIDWPKDRILYASLYRLEIDSMNYWNLHPTWVNFWIITTSNTAFLLLIKYARLSPIGIHFNSCGFIRLMWAHIYRLIRSASIEDLSSMWASSTAITCPIAITLPCMMLTYYLWMTRYRTNIPEIAYFMHLHPHCILNTIIELSSEGFYSLAS